MKVSLARWKNSEGSPGSLLQVGLMLMIVSLLLIVTAPLVSAAGSATELAGQGGLSAHGYVIRLSSTSRQFTADEVDGLNIPVAHRIYTTSFRKDGKVWQQLRIGFFSSKAEAHAVLKNIEKRFPGAQVTAVTSVDRQYPSTTVLASSAVSLDMPAREGAYATAPAAPAPGKPVLAGTTRDNVSSFVGKISRFSPSSRFGGKSKDGTSGGSVSQGPAGTGRPNTTADKENNASVAGKVAPDVPAKTDAPVTKSGNAGVPAVPRRAIVPAVTTAARTAEGFADDEALSSSAASGSGKDDAVGKVAVTRSRTATGSTSEPGVATGSPAVGHTFFSSLKKLSPASRFSKNTQGNAAVNAVQQQDGMVKVAATSAAAVSSTSAGFDHAATGFILEGAHTTADCSSCHLQGVFEGTPTQCITCHASGSRMSGQNMSADHIKTMPMCEECHTSQQWAPLLRMNHDVVTGSCSSCHDSKKAAGKSQGHISTSESCETCHTTFSWTATSFDHSGVSPGTCFSCHNGSRALGKKASHVASANSCDDCHNTNAWIPALFDHGGVNGNCSTCHNGSTATGRNSTHINTSSTCEACHATNMWKPVLHPDHSEVIGTCFSCHNGTTAGGKSVNHIASPNTCDDCHNTSTFTSAVFDHSGVTGGCSSCHNGSVATGKNGTHMQTTSVCEDCHGTTSFAPALHVDHADVLGTCFSCHNGTTAPGKLPNHITSGSTCDDCHTTNAWIPAVFDHSGVTAPCSTCHNGTTASGKLPTHVQTSGQCDDCHTTIAWIPASFDHSLVTGSCSNCHNGSTATGKISNHFITSLQCDDCHDTSSWLPARFQHTSGAYPGDHRGNPVCTDCHTGNTQVIPWPSPSYQPDCAGCHANDYKPGEDDHRTLSQDRDCSGSCHQSSPEHSVNSSDW